VFSRPAPAPRAGVSPRELRVHGNLANLHRRHRRPRAAWNACVFIPSIWSWQGARHLDLQPPPLMAVGRANNDQVNRLLLGGGETPTAGLREHQTCAPTTPKDFETLGYEVESTIGWQAARITSWLPLPRFHCRQDPQGFDEVINGVSTKSRCASSGCQAEQAGSPTPRRLPEAVTTFHSLFKNRTRSPNRLAIGNPAMPPYALDIARRSNGSDRRGQR